MDHLMREHNRIFNLQNAASNVINQAVEIRNDLRNQGMSLGRAKGLMGQIAGNIPGIRAVQGRHDCRRGHCLSHSLYIVVSSFEGCGIFNRRGNRARRQQSWLVGVEDSTGVAAGATPAPGLGAQSGKETGAALAAAPPPG